MSREKNRDIRLLIPFYVAGTLGSGESQEVEQALKSDPALVGDLEFWQSAAEATQAQAESQVAGHPSSELLVDYVEGLMEQASEPAAQLQAHLSACVTCRQEYEQLRATIERPSNKPVQKVGRQSRFALPFHRSIWWPRLAAAALVIAVGVFSISQYLDSSPQTISIQLTYNNAVRSADVPDVPELTLADKDELVSMTLRIPHSQLEEIDYGIVISAREADGEFRVEKYTRKQLDQQYDEIGFTLMPSEVFHNDGLYRIVVSERLPTGSNLAPETYEFQLQVTRRKP